MSAPEDRFSGRLALLTEAARNLGPFTPVPPPSRIQRLRLWIFCRWAFR